jgi:hypothetical protein
MALVIPLLGVPRRDENLCSDKTLCTNVPRTVFRTDQSEDKPHVHQPIHGWANWAYPYMGCILELKRNEPLMCAIGID